MDPRVWRQLRGYGVAIVSVAVATAVWAGIWMLIGNRVSSSLFLAAVIAASRLGGVGPGWLALLLGTIPVTYTQLEFHAFDASVVVVIAVHVLLGMELIWVNESERTARQSALRNAADAKCKQSLLEQEITEREQAETKLQFSQDRFHHFVDNGPFAAFLKDEQGRYVYVNKTVERSSGRMAADWMGKTDYDLFPSDAARRCMDDDRGVLQSCRVMHFDDTTQWPDGSVQYWSTIKFVLPAESGPLLGGVAVDVTAMRQAAEQAQAKEAQLLLALDAGRMGFWSWDLTTNRVHSSPTQAVMHGRSPDRTETMIGDSDESIHPDDRQHVRSVIERAMRNEADERTTYRVVWPDRSVHWVEAVGRVFCDEFGTPKHVMGVCTDITEKKRVENELRESEERFRLLAMYAPVGIAQSDADGRTFFVNSKWCEIAGASPEEPLGYGWQQFLHPDDRQRLVDAWQADMAAGKTHSTAEFRFLRRDGSIRWASSTASLIGDANGHPIGQIGITIDVTERREAEQRFKDIYEQSPLGIALIDSSTGRFLQVNPRYEQILGRAEDQLVKLTVREVTHPEDRQASVTNMALMREGHVRRLQLEKRLLRGDGSVIWANATIVPMWRVGETPSRHLAIIEDITRRREVEDKLRLRESQFSGILDHSPAVVYLKDSAGHYLLTNRRHQALFNRGNADIVGKHDNDLFPAEIARQFIESDAKVWRENAPHDFEELAPHADGLHTYRSVKFPVCDEAGRMIALGGISTDISDLRAAHDALKGEQNLLRRMIEAQEQKNHFICQEFHDGLIQYAVGSLMSLEGFRNDHPTLGDTGRIDTVIENLRKGIDDGRRVIRGVRPAVLDDSGLAAAIEDLVGQFWKSGILVTSKCDPEIGRFPNSIQTTVYRLVQEALNNAQKHSGTDVVRIELKRSNDDLLLDVRDFGCGFDVDEARDRGFGLVGMAERVRLHGGECQIVSEPDVGTHISVRLPIPPGQEA